MSESVIEDFSDFSPEDMDWMHQALAQAALALTHHEVPVGAVIVHDGQIIGRGYNCPILLSDPTAHAEVQAIRDACKNINNYRLPEDSTLYVTLEPCTQCVGALIHARISRVVFAAFEPRAGSLVSARQLLQQGFYNHYFAYQGGCLAQESGAMLKQFFKNRRAQAKSAKLDNPNSQI
ncbi:tRNA adenosine(34) deaminase TadA [Acinetobacter puyangensis]|uniref:tRNA-specific adenosine deaminase n=2 Tax=Acinetobacter TaxID=469 RepID=A0A1Z9YZA0_9GAMM|nr:tRNA-specific adenosine deaminase [Acinetobacter populi]SNX44118.1 tRNA(Arg) A34 adenosine deaminase TadA [Acinetobacter puyangensis]